MTLGHVSTGKVTVFGLILAINRKWHSIKDGKQFLLPANQQEDLNNRFWDFAKRKGAPNRIYGRMPVNPEYAGKTFFDALPKNLQTKYPNGVKFDSKGFPNFSPYSKKSTNIKYTGSRTGDYDAANQAAGFSETPKGYTWHHHQDVGANGVGRMELVPSDLHGKIPQSGGVSRWQELFPGQGSY